MIIKKLPSGPFGTNAYLLACPETKETLIIDPGVESKERILRTLKDNEFIPKAIVLTHSHWDHIGDVAALQRQLGIPVLIHSLDAPNLIDPGCDGIPCPLEIPPTTPDCLLSDGDTIPVGTCTFRVIHTPGHSPGGICLYNKEEGILITGDTLFKKSIGHVNFSTGQPDLMWESLAKLEKLPPETKVYPGHGVTTTIGEEEWLPRAKELFGNYTQ